MIAALPSPRRALHLIERNLMVYRRTWPVLLTGAFEPVFYLLGIGVGLGSLVGRVPLEDGRVVPYAVFVAPAMMATAAMNGAVYESVFNLFFKLRYGKIYDAILVTPVATADVAAGEVAWALMRGGLYSLAFLALMAGLGYAPSPLAVLAWPAALLLGWAFSAVGTAVTTFLRRWQDFDAVMLVVLPLFLFSGTFFPPATYPGPLRWLVELSPLYRGVHLIRGLTTGGVSWLTAVDILVLAGLGVAGTLVTRVRLDRLLFK